MKRTLFCVAFATLVIGCQSNDESTPIVGTTPVSGEFAKVQAIFTRSCIGCHKQNGGPDGVSLTSYEHVMKGGEDGPIVKAGDPANSILIRALRGQGIKRMPMKAQPLPENEIKVVEDWVKAGAKA